VVVAKIGDDLRMDYTAQGETVGLAARLEQLADPGSVYVSERTAALVTGYFALRDLGTFTVKGVSAPARIYELEGAGRLRTRNAALRAGGVDLGISPSIYSQDRRRAKARALMDDHRAPKGERKAAERAFEALRLRGT
jgi:hypothetical protein